MPTTHLPSPPDHTLIALMLLLTICEWRWYWPRVLRALARQEPGARLRVYRNILAGEWLLTAAVAFVWWHAGRPWEAFRLGAAPPLRVAIGFALAAAYAALAVAQGRAILARPQARERVARRFSHADPLIPRTPGERIAMACVAVTAGVCEEFLFRGFVLWYCTASVGPVAGFVLTALMFGFGHVYMGYAHVVRTAVIGALFGAIVLATGSLWPAIAMHVAMDAISGEFGFRLFRAVDAERAPTGLLASM